MDLVTFAEEILNGKPHFLCGGDSKVNGKRNSKRSEFSNREKGHCKILKRIKAKIIPNEQKHEHYIQISKYES